MINADCIILAGGLGTRLRGVIGEAPKCMAPVNDKPFLHYLFQYLKQQGCSRIILSLGYKHDVVIDWLKSQQLPFDIDWVIEEEPLGTGGGIRLAMDKVRTDQAFILNGDTFFDVKLSDMQAFHSSADIKPEVSLALKHLHNFERYGSVSIDGNKCITAFAEKTPKKEGLINGGIYLLNTAPFLAKPFPSKFSFEKDYLEDNVRQGMFYGFESNGYFIDIGIPEDYDKAQHDFQNLFPA